MSSFCLAADVLDMAKWLWLPLLVLSRELRSAPMDYFRPAVIELPPTDLAVDVVAATELLFYLLLPMFIDGVTSMIESDSFLASRAASVR